MKRLALKIHVPEPVSIPELIKDLNPSLEMNKGPRPGFEMRPKHIDAYTTHLIHFTRINMSFDYMHMRVCNDSMLTNKIDFLMNHLEWQFSCSTTCIYT